jgi:hypothetical protein
VSLLFPPSAIGALFPVSVLHEARQERGSERFVLPIVQKNRDAEIKRQKPRSEARMSEELFSCLAPRSYGSNIPISMDLDSLSFCAILLL